MKDFEPGKSFLGAVAQRYDEFHDRGDEVDAVGFLGGLATNGRALEFAIGTGRIAIPLSTSGVEVDGIELSPDMVAELRAKPGGDRLNVILGDMTQATTGTTYSLVYLVFNTFYNVLTQDGQVDCFINAARHLDVGGSFVVEAFTPGYLHRLRDSQYVDAESINVGEVRLDVGRHDAVNQILDESHVSLSRHGISVVPVVARYAWPSELDLMARIAGLKLTHRHGGWNNEPFTSDSKLQVSVYTKPDH